MHRLTGAAPPTDSNSIKIILSEGKQGPPIQLNRKRRKRGSNLFIVWGWDLTQIYWPKQQLTSSTRARTKMIKLTNQAVNAQITNSSMSLQELAVWQDPMPWLDYRHKTSFKGKRKMPQQPRKVVKKQCKYCLPYYEKYIQQQLCVCI